MASSVFVPKKIVRPHSIQLRVLGVNADSVFALPGGYGLTQVFYENLTSTSVTINCGTTDGGADIFSAVVVGANAIGHVTAAGLLKRYFSRTVPQNIFLTSAGWTTGVLNVTFVGDKISP